MAQGFLSAIQKQATFAGNTSPPQPAPGAPRPATGVELASLAGIRSELDHIVSGGIHPEVSALFQPASRALEQASNAVRGPHGGLIPRGVNQLGPAGTAALARVRAGLARVLQPPRRQG